MKRDPKHMWEERIWKLLLQQSTPAVIWMLIMSLYNFVDTIFIGRGVGTDGIAAVSIVFPIQMIIGAFAMALGIGTSSIISRKLWAQKSHEVARFFGTFQVSNIVLWLLFSVLWFIFSKYILLFFGATTEILSLSNQYFSILLIGVTFFCFNMANNNIIRSVGHSKVAMMVMVISALINVAMDAILIFGFDMWMAGAAWATVISWITGSIVAIGYYLSKHNIIHTTILDYKVSWHRLKDIILIGAPSLARQIATSGVMILINKLLWIYGWSLAIAAFGIVNRVFMVFFMPMFGIVQWMQPILWYNHGAGFHHRVKQVSTLAIKVLTIFCVIVWILWLTIPKPILSLFSNDAALLNVAVSAMRISVILFPFVWVQMVASGFYQALGKVKPAFLFAILRQVILLIPILLILPRLLGLDGVWYSFPLADLLATTIILVVFIRDLRKIH